MSSSYTRDNVNYSKYGSTLFLLDAEADPPSMPLCFARAQDQGCRPLKKRNNALTELLEPRAEESQRKLTPQSDLLCMYALADTIASVAT